MFLLYVIRLGSGLKICMQ